MPFLRRDGVALHYELSRGDAVPVVLIHGWCCDHRHMAPLAQHFAQAGHTVLALDLRGHGGSDKPQQAYPIGAFADDVAWCCHALGLERPVLIGHSMGGIVAYELAEREPLLPGAIVMLDSAVVLPAAAREGVPRLLDKLSGPDYVETLREFVARVLFLPSDAAARKAGILDAMTATPQHVMLAAYAGLAEYDAASSAGRYGGPALYIAANEPSPRSDMARLRELLPQLQTAQTAGSGHFCQLEVPEQVQAMIERFLAITLT
jgi:pimeloyl-ACP methyl ester carboxylesterase